MTIKKMDDLISKKAAIEYFLLNTNWFDEEGNTIDNWDEKRELLEDEFNGIPSAQQWIPCSERLPSKEERKEWIDKNLGGIGYLYPCLVTRYSSINPDRTKNNPYVAKHYYDGEDFVNNGEEVCSEYIIAWQPLPEPYVEVKNETD